MLLSSTASNMYWTARYLERAQALARVIRAYGRLALDLPASESLDFTPLLALVDRPCDPATSERDKLHALVADAENPSSVRGALGRARENLRSGRVVTPPVVWSLVNGMYGRLEELATVDSTVVFDALEALNARGSEVEGELSGTMTRDEAYAFFRIGAELERADMSLRTLAVLVPLLGGSGARAFEDVRVLGLLEALGARAMYGRRHHCLLELEQVLEFLLLDATFPRSLRHATLVLGRELDRLPRPGPVHFALRELLPKPSALEGGLLGSGRSLPQRLRALHGLLEQLTAAVGRVHDALQATYFEAERPSPSALASSPQRSAHEPFAELGREHATIEGVLALLDELTVAALCGESVARDDLLAIVGFFNDSAVIAHHEKEESVLMPMLLTLGFAWYDGPLAAIRRDHRHEHYFLRVLAHLGQQREDWSAEDRRQFVSVAQEFAQFVREHMRREHHDVFLPAAERLNDEQKGALFAAFARLDAELDGGLATASARLGGLRRKYGTPLSASA